jgi:hypothetical protein
MEIFAVLTSLDGYRLVIGPDPIVSHICIQAHSSNDEHPLGTCHVFYAAGSLGLGFVPLG